MQLDRRMILDAADEIARHRRRQSARSHQHVHAPRALGEEHGGLPRGVAAADHDHLFARAELRLHERGRVVDADTFEARERLERRLAILRTGRDDDCACANAVALLAQVDRVRPLAAVEPGRRARDQQLRTELVAPGSARGRRAPGRRCRSGIPGSSRSASSSPPARPARAPRSRGHRGLRRLHRPPPTNPPGPAPTTITSRMWSAAIGSLSPRHSAICASVGLRSTRSPRQMSTGTSSCAHVKPVEQLLHVASLIEVDERIRMAVATEELPHPQRARAVIRAEQHDVAEAAGNEPDTPQNERAQQDLADLRVALNELEQARAIELDDLAAFAHARLRERASPAEQVHFTGELRRARSATTSVSPSGPCCTISTWPGEHYEERRHAARPREPGSRPATIARTRPCAATRATCGCVSRGNIRSGSSAMRSSLSRRCGVSRPM